MKKFPVGSLVKFEEGSLYLGLVLKDLDGWARVFWLNSDGRHCYHRSLIFWEPIEQLIKI